MLGMIRTYFVPQTVLDDTHAFLYQRGLLGCEGAALWIAKPQDAVAQVTRLFVPEQRCIKTPWGAAVELTEEAHYTLTDHLEPGERIAIRIHSHPHEAYHSPRDDANAVITHDGAISIVVPDFAREPLDLTRCAVYCLAHGRGWVRLDPDEVRSILQVIS